MQALEEIASGEREMLPPFDAREDRIAADVARLEANYQRFRALITSLSPAQLDLPATPYNPENNYPALSLLDLIERTSGHEGNHARQVVETRRFVAAFRSAERAVTVAGLGTGDPAAGPDAGAGNAGQRRLCHRFAGCPGRRPPLDPLGGIAPASGQPRRVGQSYRARHPRRSSGPMVVTLGDPAESMPSLLSDLEESVGAVSLIPAPGFYRLALERSGLSPLKAVCGSVERIGDVAEIAAASGRAVVILGSDDAGIWRDAAGSLQQAGIPADTSGGSAKPICPPSAPPQPRL